MIIEITKKLENDIFGQYEAIYKGETKIIETGGMYGGEIKLNVSSGMTITVETKLELPTIPIKVEGIWSIYAKNPQRGAVLTITK